MVFSQQDTKRNLDGEQFCEIFPAGVEAGDVPDFEFSLWSSDESCPLESILTRLLWGDALTESDVKLVEEEDLFLLEVTGQLEINIIDFRFTFASQHYFVYEKRKMLKRKFHLGVFVFLMGDFCSRFGSFGGGLKRGLSLGGNMALGSDDLNSVVTALPADHPSSGGSVLAFGLEVA